MSLQRNDILRAAFVEDPQQVEELVLVHKGLTDIACLATETLHLTSLNAAFNSLTSVACLSSLTCLSSLNLSHNRLAKLCGKGLCGLPGLTYLNLGHNQLTNCSGLAACTALQELYLQSNQLAALADLQPLSHLTALNKLCVAVGNPVGKRHASTIRPALLALCPTLQNLDGAPVTDADVSDPTAWQTCSQPPPPPDASPIKSALAALPVWSGVDSQVDRASRHSAPVQSRMQRGRMQRAHKAAAKGSGTGSILRGPPAQEGGPQGGAAVGADHPDQESASPPHQEDHRATTLLPVLVASSSKSRGRDGSPTGSVRTAAAAAGRMPPRLKELSPTSNFQAVLAALPTIQQSRLPPSYTPSSGQAFKAKKQPVHVPEEARAISIEIRYPGGARGRAVRGTKDGSVSVTWPNGDLAVTLDADHSQQPPTFNLLCMYRTTGNVAASWDSAAGGFVQYANCALCLVHNNGGRKGTLFSAGGQVLQKWESGTVCVATEPAVGGTESSESAASGELDIQLDSMLGMRFSLLSQQLHIDFCCDGVAHSVTCGPIQPVPPSL